MNEIEFEVLDIVTKVVGLEAGSVTTSTSIRDLGVTSMKIVEMILMIEKKYNIEMPDDATYTIETAGQLIAAVQVLVEINREESLATH
ncbi:acyl carrier protein [Pseudomonas sp. NPDC096950]|uniref:acyl carrier protein n=1 Tax=Pseudomonas sp. NPDC096950 TaxID=3364485 RepID=UPI00383AC063